VLPEHLQVAIRVALLLGCLLRFRHAALASAFISTFIKITTGTSEVDTSEAIVITTTFVCTTIITTGVG
jgi:hypothetical protein